MTDTSSGQHFERHWHEAYGFGLLDHGAHVSASGRGQVRAYQGDVITSNPGEVHDGRPLGGATRRWLMVHLDVDSMTALVGGPPEQAEITRPVITDARLVLALRQLFTRVERWQAERDLQTASALACEEALVESAVLLVTRYGASPMPTSVAASDVRFARELLADASLAPPTLAEMAAMAGISRYQLLRRFTRAYGLPPHAWLLRQRVERARALILAGSGLAEAAARSGFADQSHMTRLFVRFHGFTPGALRRSTRDVAQRSGEAGARCRRRARSSPPRSTH